MSTFKSKKPRLKSAKDFENAPTIRTEDLAAIEQVSKKYAVGLTPHVLETMQGSVAIDAVAKQYIPQIEELKTTPEENPDPIGDYAHTPVKGLDIALEELLLRSGKRLRRVGLRRAGQRSAGSL